MDGCATVRSEGAYHTCMCKVVWKAGEMGMEWNGTDGTDGSCCCGFLFFWAIRDLSEVSYTKVPMYVGTYTYKSTTLVQS